MKTGDKKHADSHQRIPLFQRFSEAISGLLSLKNRIQKSHALRKLKPVLLLLCIPCGFLLLEMPYNEMLFSMSIEYVVINLVILSVIFGVFLGLGQGTRLSAILFLTLCFGMGIANHFVISFRGQPVIPADLLALSTAADVGSRYVFSIDPLLVVCLLIFLAACLVILLLPTAKKAGRKSTIRSAAYALLGIYSLLFLCVGFSSIDVEEDFDCSVGPWSIGYSYCEQGSTLCFIQLLQNLRPALPSNYDESVIDALLMPDTAVADAPETNSAFADSNTAIASFESRQDVVKPTVIAIMNESFSDLSRYPDLANTEAYPQLYYQCIQDAEQSGFAFVSALGSGTCNSEFEFLTGSSMGHLGESAYPYTTYYLDNCDNLAKYFNELGYTTSALHPAEKKNWRRDKVYPQLGFDAFYDIDSFQDAPYLRSYVSDRGTYDKILSLLEENDNPQFIFDVTIQNHGGYAQGGVSETDLIHIPLPDGSENTELNEFVSCIKASEDDIDYLLTELNALNRPIVLCFFGDYQPGFAEAFLPHANSTENLDALSLEEAQILYEVPYFIWKNQAAKDAEQSGEASRNETTVSDLGNSNASFLIQNDTYETQPDNGEVAGDAFAATSESIADTPLCENATKYSPTSLNYLGAELIRSAGLPLSPYQNYLLKTSALIPAINTNGYLTSDFIWHELDEETEVTPNLNAYEQVQYKNLFGKK